VRPEGDLKVTLEGSAVSKGPLTKSPLRLTIDAPTKVLIERRGYEPYSLTLNPEDQQVKRQRPINVELTPFFYPTELTVLALPGCKVWLNGERLQEVTPIRGLEVQPSETGELHVKVVHPRSGAQEQRQQVKRGEVRPRHAFMFDF